MKDIQTIKTRLAAIQGNFNPQKNTYKVIEYVVNNDLNYNEMLMELSKIRGFSKYPEDLKNEYVSIINDIKENIINQRRKDEEERQKANTRELKDIIDSLEKTRIQYLMKQDEEAEEILGEDDSNSDVDLVKSEQEVNLESEKTKVDASVITEKSDDKEEFLEQETESDESIPKVKKSLIFGIILIIVLIGLALFFY